VARDGIALYNQGEARDNAVLRCGGTGIVLRGEDYSTCYLTGNTSALNQGSGYVLAIPPTSGSALVSNNIGYGNAGAGLAWTGLGAPTFGCNDWFENTGGTVTGTAAGSTDLSVDPLFCDLPNDDIRLRADSPLVAGACDTIGARGVGCDPSTEVLVALFAAEASDRGVSIRWRLGGDERPVSVWIERGDREQGPWRRIAAERATDGDITVDWDRDIEPGRVYWYRLAWITTDGQESRSSPIRATAAPAAADFGLRAIGPIPADGAIAIEYTLPRSAAIELTVHDLLGRELARLAGGVQAQGLHVARWAGEVRGGRAGPGAYFVRLTWPEGRQSRRILLRR
jgi:hypothetical protein